MNANSAAMAAQVFMRPSPFDICRPYLESFILICFLGGGGGGREWQEMSVFSALALHDGAEFTSRSVSDISI